jgi:hypothetical protein
LEGHHALIYREAEARNGARSAISPATNVRFSPVIDDGTLNPVTC